MAYKICSKNNYSLYCCFFCLIKSDRQKCEQVHLSQILTNFLLLDAAKEDAIGSFKEKNPINIAKSLPMDIPVFMSSFQNHLQEDADDSLVSVKPQNRKSPLLLVN